MQDMTLHRWICFGSDFRKQLHLSSSLSKHAVILSSLRPQFKDFRKENVEWELGLGMLIQESLQPPFRIFYISFRLLIV